MTGPASCQFQQQCDARAIALLQIAAGRDEPPEAAERGPGRATDWAQ
jgi:hypothetical protein